MKRKYALAAALVGALVLTLCSCAGGIEGKAQQYLSSRYSGEFTITDAERNRAYPCTYTLVSLETDS